jgi:hypothetical protein
LAAKRAEEAARQLRQEQEEAKGDGEESDEELRGLDERLKKAPILKESKLIIHAKVTDMDNRVAKTLEERGRALEERASPAKKK